MKNIVLALIDSHLLLRHVFGLQLQSIGFTATIEAENGNDLIDKATGSYTVPEICIVNIDTPPVTGLTTVRLIRSHYPNIKIIAYTVDEIGYDTANDPDIDLFIGKGCTTEELKRHIMLLAED